MLTRLIYLVKIQIQKKLIENSLVSLIKSHYKSIFFLHSIILRLGAQSFMSLNTLRDPTQLRQCQLATRQQHLFFGCPLLSSLEQLISAPNHE